MTKILESLRANNTLLDVISERLDRINGLFGGTTKDHLSTTHSGFVIGDEIEAKTVFQNEDVTVTIAQHYPKGSTWPIHKHDDSLEYLIVFRGSFLYQIDGIPRVMKKGDCASIARGVSHSCVALEDESCVMGICIPPEKAYLVEDFQCRIFPEKS